MEPDGRVVIQAVFDEEGIDKGIANVERKLKELENKPRTDKEQQYYERLQKTLSNLYHEKAKLNDQKLGFFGQIQQASNLSNELEKVTNEYGKLRAQQMSGTATEEEVAQMNRTADAAGNLAERINDLTEGQTVNAQELLEEQDRIAELNVQLNDYLAYLQSLQGEKIQSEADLQDIEQVKEAIREVREELERLTGQKIYIKGIDDVKTKMEGVRSSVKGIHKSSGNVLKKITRWGLAILGIRSAFALIRQAMSSVLSDNKKLSAQYEGLKKSLYGSLAPIIEKIINLLRTLMAYANYIWKRLFPNKGDLFANSVKSSSKTAKNAKEINKQLAGFDEANVLSDNKSGDSGGTTNLGLDKIKIPDWLKRFMDWVEKNPKIAAILFGLAAFTLFGLVSTGAISGLAAALTGVLGTISLIAATVVICKVAYDAVVEAYNAYMDLRHEQAVATEHAKETAKANIKLDETFKKEYETIGKTNEQIDTYIGHIWSTVQQNRDQIESTNLSKEARKELNKETNTLIATYNWLYEQGAMTEEQERQYYEFLRNEMAHGLDITNNKLGITIESFDALDKKYKTDYEVSIKTKGKEALESLANLLNNSNVQKFLGSKFTTFIGDLKNFHADGGIVNLPGKGVPINYVGEAGREGIVPIDNESQMALLGSEIAKRVTINLTNINQMNGRTISREMVKIQDNSSFLTNS